MDSLTLEEIEEVYGILYDKAYYGDDEIVYTEKGDTLRSALNKIEKRMREMQKNA